MSFNNPSQVISFYFDDFYKAFNVANDLNNLSNSMGVYGKNYQVEAFLPAPYKFEDITPESKIIQKFKIVPETWPTDLLVLALESITQMKGLK